MPSREFALVVGSSRYADRRLTRLVSPEADVAGLSALLESPELGQFDEVRTLVDAAHSELLKEMWRFLGGDKRADDFVLVYYSGHGVKDEQGKLYLACPDTDTDLLRATAIPAADLTDALDQCRARRQVVILDCCNSGAFRRGTKGVRGESVGTRSAFAGTASAFRGEGQGRVILTATDATQYAMEGDDLSGEAQRSVFTRHLLAGLRTGEADQNADGWIGVDELYEYVHSHVVQETPAQQPCKFADDVRGEFVIGKRPRGTERAVPLPASLEEDLHSTSVSTRVDAIQELAMWLGGAHIGRVLAATTALRQVVASDDSLRARTAAQQALEAHPPAFDRPDSSTPEKITVLAPSGRPDPDPDPEPAPVPPVPPVHEDVRAAWMVWALTESRGNQAVAAAGVEAALAAAGAGPDAGADAARRAMASAASAPHISPQPAGAAAAPSQQPPVQPAPLWTPPAQPAQPQPAPVWQQAQAAPPLARPPEAMISLVLGILSVVTCFIGIVLGPLAIWYGRRARQRVRESAGQLGGTGLGTAGIWLGATGTGVSVVGIIYTVIYAAMHSSGG
jgi:Caspase domain